MLTAYLSAIIAPLQKESAEDVLVLKVAGTATFG